MRATVTLGKLAVQKRFVLWHKEANERARPEATERDAEGEAQVIGGSLGVELLDVLGKGCAFGAIYGELGPVCRVTPWGRARVFELDGALAVGFVGGER